MHWSKVTKPPTDRRLREFAATAACVLTALAIWQISRTQMAWSAALALVAIATALLGWLQPRLLAPLFRLAIIVTFPIAWLMSHLLLAAMFFGILTPLAIFFRLMGRDALDRRLGKDQDSYWQPREPPAPRRYFRQY